MFTGLSSYLAGWLSEVRTRHWLIWCSLRWAADQSNRFKTSSDGRLVSWLLSKQCFPAFVGTPLFSVFSFRPHSAKAERRTKSPDFHHCCSWLLNIEVPFMEIWFSICTFIIVILSCFCLWIICWITVSPVAVWNHFKVWTTDTEQQWDKQVKL